MQSPSACQPAGWRSVLELAEPLAPLLMARTPASGRDPVVDGVVWRVQQCGQGPVVLLLHGTGSAAGSWRGLIPELARHFTVVAPDLPGHGRSGDPGSRGLSLSGMSAGLRRLLDVLRVEPQWVIGHSAGAALACRMCLDGRLAPERVVSINGALLPPLGMPLEIFAPLARLLAAVPLLPSLLALRARDGAAVSRLIEGTGSHLDAEGLEFYRQLMRDPGHVSAALRMMAGWDLPGLARELPKLAVPLDLVVGERDRSIPPGEALRVQRALPASRIFALPALGHLAHEENPAAVMAVLRGLLGLPGAV